MKKIYLITIAISLGLGVIFPWCVYKVFGFFWNSVAVDEKYVDQAALLIMMTLLLIASVVALSKYGRESIDFSKTAKSKLLSGKAAEHLFLFAIGLNLINVVRVGKFSNLISGGATGTIISYLQIFLDLRILYYLALLLAYKKKRISKILFYSFLYVGVSVLYSTVFCAPPLDIVETAYKNGAIRTAIIIKTPIFCFISLDIFIPKINPEKPNKSRRKLN